MPTLEQFQAQFDGLQRTIEEFKNTNAKQVEDIKAGKYVPADQKEKLERIEKGLETLEQKLENVVTAYKRVDTQSAKEEADAVQAKAKSVFNAYLKRGRMDAESQKALVEAMPEELKAMAVDSDPAGGYLVRPHVSNAIQSKLFETSPMRKIASSITIGSDAFEEPSDWDEAGGEWVGERQSRSETDTPDLGMLRIAVHELAATPRQTQKFLDDAAIDAEAWLQGKVAEKFERLENTSFVSGNGIAKPRGFLSYTAGDGYGLVEQVVSGVAGDFTGDSFIDLQDSALEEFQHGACWLMRRATRSRVRKLVDGQGRYLWNVDGSLNDGVQFLLLEKPVHLAADMPAVAGDALAVAYGDFKKGYLIVDRIGIRVLRDPYSAKPWIQFYTTKRVGGGVRHFQAIKLMKLAAS